MRGGGDLGGCGVIIPFVKSHKYRISSIQRQNPSLYEPSTYHVPYNAHAIHKSSLPGIIS